MIEKILMAAFGAVIRVLFGRWIAPKDPEKEMLHDALEAKSREAVALAAPDRSKPDVVASLRQHVSIH